MVCIHIAKTEYYFKETEEVGSNKLQPTPPVLHLDEHLLYRLTAALTLYKYYIHLIHYNSSIISRLDTTTMHNPMEN